MPTPSPIPDQFNNPATTQNGFRAALTQLVGYVNGLLGSDGAPMTARALLGLGNQPTVFNNRGNYANSTAYAFDDYVIDTSNGLAYLCTLGYMSPSSAGAPSGDTTHWQLQQGVTLGALASTSSGQGADLIPTAPRNFLSVASLRAAPVPTGPAPYALVQYGATIGDQLGGPWIYDPHSTAVDDGTATTSAIKPSAVLLANPGRWVKPLSANGLPYFGGSAADRLDSPAAVDVAPIITRDALSSSRTGDPTIKAGQTAGRAAFQIDLPVHIGTRRNLWMHTEDVGSSFYAPNIATKQSDTIVVDGITLTRVSTANFYGSLYSPISGLGLTPYVAGQRYLVSYYALSRIEGEQFTIMRQLVNNADFGHGTKLLTNRLRRIWQVVQATATNATTVITTPTIALGGEAGGGNLTWLFQAITEGAGTLEAYVGGFMIEQLPDATYKDGISMIGDSTMQGSSNSVDLMNTNAREVSTWLGALLNVNVFNRAIGGQRTDQMDARWATDMTPLAANCKYTIIQGGINDIGQGRSLSAIQGSFTSMWNKAVTDGTIPILFTCTPAIGISSVTGGEAIRLQLNTWMKQTFPNVIDIASVISDPHVPSQIRNSATWAGDLTHYQGPAKRAVGIYAASWPGWDFMTPSQYQPVAAATYTPVGALFHNGLQVVGPRSTGWTTATGTPNKGAFAADTATTVQTAQRLLAIEQALVAHGLIGA